MEIGIEKINKYYDTLIEVTSMYGLKILAATAIFLIGVWIIGKFTKLIDKLMVNNNMDPSLRPFLLSMINISLKVLLTISVISMIGIETSSFVAVLGAAGLAIGFALQGSLANFAGGMLTLIFKPYKVGDLIESQNHVGVVQEIHIFVTRLITPDNRMVIIPNGSISNSTIINYTSLGIRRIDLTVGISYNDDIKKAKTILLEALINNPNVLKSPEPFVGVKELGDSSVNLTVRPWCNADDYWDVYFECLEDCKYALDKNGITIPFPQRDVHVFNAK